MSVKAAKYILQAERTKLKSKKMKLTAQEKSGILSALHADFAKLERKDRLLVLSYFEVHEKVTTAFKQSKRIVGNS